MRIAVILIACLFTTTVFAGNRDSLQWIEKKQKGFTLHYTSSDTRIMPVLERNLILGIKTASSYFGNGYKKDFDVYIFPNRKELNIQWRKDWGMPDFNSECWMVASGVAHRLDVLSHLSWKTDACEHNPSDSIEIQKIIVHELVHVYHGQYNPNPTFDGMDDLSWLIEGLATYVSGQLNEKRINSVKTQLKEGKIPAKLSELWKGGDKYGRAGSFIQFLHQQYGRKKLIELLAYTDLASILKALNTTEDALINAWKEKMTQ